MKLITLIKRILCTVSLMAIMPASYGADLIPRTFIAVDVEVRELTLEGMAERVQLLSSGNSTPRQEEILDDASRRAISQAYQDNGTTAAAHAAYGTQHAEEITAWLSANPEWQAHFDTLADEWESLSNQLDALREGN